MSKLEPTRTYSNPTATDVVRRLLDERGVEWGNIRNDGSESDYLTEWQFDGIEGHAIATEWSVGHLTVCIAHPMTPEQAIAATLGAGTCEADETDLIPFVRADSGDFEVDYIHVMECTECGHTYEHVNGDYEYCPRCGRKREDVSE